MESIEGINEIKFNVSSVEELRAQIKNESNKEDGAKLNNIKGNVIDNYANNYVVQKFLKYINNYHPQYSDIVSSNENHTDES